MEVEIDLVGDFRQELARELQQLGYDLPVSTGDDYDDAHRVCVDHWNAMSRRIEARPRFVHWSGELRAREERLSAALRAGLESATRELECGEDLTPRLSRKLSARAFNDKMLHDWGIHHLHLGTVLAGDGFVERTGDVLFVMVRPKHVYLIDVRGHSAWTDDELVDILHTNWPDEISMHRLDAVGLRHALTSVHRKNIRDKNANAAVQTRDGTVYGGLGGALVASGSNARAVIWGDYMIKKLQAVQEAVSQMDASVIAEDVLAVTGARPARLVMRLAELARDHALVLVENAVRPYAIRIRLER